MFIVPILLFSLCFLICYVDYLQLQELKRRKMRPKDISKDPFEDLK